MSWQGGKYTFEVIVPEPKSVALDPATTALIVVDMENEFCHPEGKLYMGPRVDAIIPRLAGLVADCRKNDVPVIFIQSLRSADALEFRRSGRTPHLLESTWNVEIIPELAPLLGEAVVQKRSHDPFTHTGLDGVLLTKGINPETHTVIATGVACNVCVAACVVGLSHRSYRIVLPMDCTASGTEEAEAFQYAKYLSGGTYATNVVLSRSDLITMAPLLAMVGSRAASGF